MIVDNLLPVIKINKKNGLIGAVIAAAVFAICAGLYSWQMGLVFAVMFFVVGFIKFQPKHSLTAYLMNACWGVVCIFLSCCIPTYLVALNPGESFLLLGRYRIVMNMICAAVVYGIVLVVTGRVKPAVAIASGMLLILTTVNAFVFQFRGSELKPTDFLSVATAMNVAGQYNFAMNAKMAYSWILWLWTVFCLRSLPEEKPIISLGWIRLAAAVAVAACAFFVWSNMGLVPLKTWSNQGSAMNGYFLNFTIGLRTCFVNKPENYSADTMEALEMQYTDADPSAGTEDLPNIIVIMSESFVDISAVGDNFHTNQAVTPFIDSLEENTIKGHALASVYGGNTANSEFEFLTGHSMAWLPTGSVPYQQYVREEAYNLTWLMRSLGYTTMATHPYLSDGWNRTKVYPAFGFQSSTFQEDYPGEQIIRTYISDQEMYEYVLDVMENKGEDPMFLFGITMQNHGDYGIYPGYNDVNFEQTIHLEGYEQVYEYAEVYLSLIHESDRATEYLLTELEKYPEDTIVVFFGDHFPKLEPAFYEEVYGGEFDTLSAQMRQYTVPFFIWANFDIPEQTVECTSLNYLSRYLLETAGIELPPYYRFLAEMEKVIPAVNAMGYYSCSQQTYLPLADAVGEEAEWLNRYQMVQYNGLFDGGNRSQSFFGQYLPEE